MSLQVWETVPFWFQSQDNHLTFPCERFFFDVPVKHYDVRNLG